MKYLIIITVFLVNIDGYVLAQNYKLKDEETFNFSVNFTYSGDDNVFQIDNISGFIYLEGYNGKDVKVEVVRVLRAHSQSNLSKARSEVSVGYDNSNDQISFYPEAPGLSFTNGKFERGEVNWNSMKDGYSYSFDYRIKVPRNTNVKIKNSSGHIESVKNLDANFLNVKNSSGHVSISNIQVEDFYAHSSSGHLDLNRIQAENLEATTSSGNIRLDEVSGKTYAKTSSGNIWIAYLKNPESPSAYYTSSGNIDIEYLDGLEGEAAYYIRNSGNFRNNTDLHVQRINQSYNKHKDESCYTKDKYKEKHKKSESTSQLDIDGNDFYFQTGNGNINLRRI